MISALLMSAWLAGAPPGSEIAEKVCQDTCDKVTRLTTSRWHKRRRKTPEEQKAYEAERKYVHAQCMTTCRKRGKPFVRCVKRANRLKTLAKCYVSRGRR
jgi:hypothetical protein